MVVLSREFYKKAVDVVYERSVGELEKVVNLALKYIFTDMDYKFSMSLSSKRGVNNLEMLLTDNSEDPPLEVDIKDGIGAGVRTVISFVLHVYYLINKRVVPVLFLDEAYSQISEDYIDPFFSFVKALCKEKGLIVVLISHDPRFFDFADKRYRVVEGVVTEV